MDWPALAKPFIDWFPDRNKVLATLSILAALALFLPWRVLCAMHVEKLADSYRGTEWIVLLFSAITLVAEGAHSFWKARHEHDEIDKRLKSMTPEEVGIVSGILNGDRAVKWPHESAYEGLHQGGILWRENPGWDNGQFKYGLEKIARKRVIALGIGKNK
jgi:hypothetical protein